MLSFRKKIFFSDLILFLVFISVLFPFVSRTVGNIVRNSLEERASHLIAKISKLPTYEGMIDYLESERASIFYRVTLFSKENVPLYDTHFSEEQEVPLTTTYPKYDPEVIEALKYGQGYSDRYSSYFRQSIAYVALSFEAQGTEYVLRIGLPSAEIRELTHDFEIGFLTFGAIILILYSLMTWAIMHRLSLPIQHITTTIAPYQEGKVEFLPRIEIGKEIQEGDEFGKLAHTLNSLNTCIQKQIESLVAQRNETETILESLGEGVIAVDIERKITFANRVACRMLIVARDSILNQTFSHILAKREKLAQKCDEIIKMALEKSEVVVQTMTLEEGNKIYFDLIAAPSAQNSGIILVLQDRTSDYRVVEMGKDFIANASHELRTPITVIRGFAETLTDLPNLSQQMLKEIAEKIVKTSMRLDSLVKSLLTLADIESLSEARFHETNLVVIIENCIHLLLTAHPNVRINLHKKIDRASILADADLIDMAIMNLLQNAVKYSPSPAMIDVAINILDANLVQVSVKDKGIGIPEADLQHIFDRFYTVDKARSRKFGGTGLGLSIVKNIVQKHRGDIQVSSQLGYGTTFIITFPILQKS